MPYPRTDSNQRQIVEYFKKRGASVANTASIKGGFPDLVIGYMGLNILVEIKTGEDADVTGPQAEFFTTWKGHTVLIYTEQGAEAVLQKMERMAQKLSGFTQLSFPEVT